jgi:rhodanese-related sulfurtransferase
VDNNRKQQENGTMPLKVGYKALLEAAEQEVRTLSLDEARALHGRDDVQFVDIRDVRELQREGKIPGAFNATRGMLEFWVDPESPYYKEVFDGTKTLVFYCQSGWRSALATQTVQRMGLENVCHIGGGYRAWKDAGGATEEVPGR